MMVPLAVLYFVMSAGPYLLVVATFGVVEVALGVAVVMAVRSWRGHDVADGPLRWLVDFPAMGELRPAGPIARQCTSHH